METFENKLAKLVVNYSINVQKGDKIAVMGSIHTEKMLSALHLEIIKAGGHPLIACEVPGLNVQRLRYGNDEQLTFLNPMQKLVFETYDGFISIRSPVNTHALGKIDPARLKISQSSEEQRKIFGTYMKRAGEGSLKWVILPYPSNAAAQDAKMDLAAYQDFIISSLMLDTEDPAAEWRKREVEQDRIKDYLNNIKTLKFIGEDTEISMSVDGRPWQNSAGHHNLPDGEIYTSPIEDSVNGKIRFTYPGIYQGKAVEDITLIVENGKVIKGTAREGQELLDMILGIEGADIFGEVAIGNNYGITEFTKSILFDEKLGGTIHMALGRGFPQAGSKNSSAIHWDILKDMKSPESKIIADEKVIYQAGKWLI